MHDVLVEEIYIEAPPERVFAAWTEAAHLIAWWGDGTEFRTVGWEGDVRAGGQFTLLTQKEIRSRLPENTFA